MKKEVLEFLISLGYSQRQIAKDLGYSQSNVKYWLKKYGLKTKGKIYNKKSGRTHKYCPKCDDTKLIGEFYKRTDRDDVQGWCKGCSNKYHTKRVREVKMRMVEYKGGECVDCTLKLEDSHYAVFEFHHLDPNEKDINFSKIKYQKWEKIKEELDKCVCLCANCHRLRHAKIEGW